MFDDVADFGEALYDAVTAGDPAKAAEVVRRAVEQNARGAALKGINDAAGKINTAVNFGAKGVDYLVNQTGLDEGHEFRDRIGFTYHGKVPSLNEGEVLDDEIELHDEGPTAPAADKLVSGWFDP